MALPLYIRIWYLLWKYCKIVRRKLSVLLWNKKEFLHFTIFNWQSEQTTNYLFKEDVLHYILHLWSIQTIVMREKQYAVQNHLLMVPFYYAKNHKNKFRTIQMLMV
jgi:hypothetical protein